MVFFSWLLRVEKYSTLGKTQQPLVTVTFNLDIQSQWRTGGTNSLPQRLLSHRLKTTTKEKLILKTDKPRASAFPSSRAGAQPSGFSTHSFRYGQNYCCHKLIFYFWSWTEHCWNIYIYHSPHSLSALHTLGTGGARTSGALTVKIIRSLHWV